MNGVNVQCDCDDNGYDYIEYTDRNYLVISVDKDTSGRNLSVDNKLYEAFLGSVKESANTNQFVATIIMELKMREIMTLFDQYFEAVSKVNSAEDVVGNEDDATKKAAAEATARKAKADAASKKTDLINGFTYFWDDYIKPSLEKHYYKSASLNSNDLTERDLSQAARQFMAKISQGVGKGIKDIDICVSDLFTWFSSGVKETNREVAKGRVNEIRQKIISLLNGNECPTSTPPTTTPSEQQT